MKFVERAARVLNERKIIAAISKLAYEKIGSPISIGFPRRGSERCNIYFVVDTSNLDTGGLTGEIKNLLNFDYEDADEKDGVVIFNRQFDSPQTLSTFVVEEDITPFAPEYYDNIHAFLKKHYHSDLQKDTNVVANQDKRQRSDSIPSTSSSSSSFFPQDGSHQEEEVKLPTAETVAEYLQQAPWWKDLMVSPERGASILDKGYGQAKRLLSDDQALKQPKTVSPQK